MQYIAIGLLVIALLALAYRKPVMGFSGLAVLAVISLIGYFLGLGNQAPPAYDQATMQWQNPQLAPGYAGGHLLKAEVTNTSDTLPIQALHLKLAAYDCADGEARLTTEVPLGCDLLGSSERQVRVFVPTLESRTVNESLSTRGMRRVAGVIVWQYEILAVE